MCLAEWHWTLMTWSGPMNDLNLNPDVIVILTGSLLIGVTAVVYLAVQVMHGLSSGAWR
jgi:hypothetical protein